jgi:hypothetical protein
LTISPAKRKENKIDFLNFIFEKEHKKETFKYLNTFLKDFTKQFFKVLSIIYFDESSTSPFIPKKEVQSENENNDKFETINLNETSDVVSKKKISIHDRSEIDDILLKIIDFNVNEWEVEKNNKYIEKDDLSYLYEFLACSLSKQHFVLQVLKSLDKKSKEEKLRNNKIILYKVFVHLIMDKKCTQKERDLRQIYLIEILKLYQSFDLDEREIRERAASNSCYKLAVYLFTNSKIKEESSLESTYMFVISCMLKDPNEKNKVFQFITETNDINNMKKAILENFIDLLLIDCEKATYLIINNYDFEHEYIMKKLNEIDEVHRFNYMKTIINSGLIEQKKGFLIDGNL